MTRIWPDILRPSFDLKELARNVAQKHDIPAFRLRERNRKTKYVQARREFVRKAYKRHSSTQIGRFLGRHHTSILHLINHY